MRLINVILVSVVTALLTSLVVGHSMLPTSSNPVQHTAYERVVATGELRCGYVNWKPYYFTDYEHGNQITGLNYDIMNELGTVLGLTIKWSEEIGWGSIGEGFKTRRYDAVCTSMWPDAAKLKNLTLSLPLFFSAPRLYVRADDTRFDGNWDMINTPDVKVAVIDGSPMFNLVKENFPKAQIVALPAMAQTAEYLMTVTGKKADIAVMDPDEIREFMGANPGQMKPIDNVPPVRVLPHYLAFPANEPQLTSMMNNGLRILIDNGVMEKIRKKYNTSYLLPAEDYRP